MHSESFDPSRLTTPTAQAAREAVDLALGFDRSATRLVALTEATSAAHLALDAQLGILGSPLSTAAWVPLRDGAQVFAENYRAACRENLMQALDALSMFADAAGAPPVDVAATPADVVLAEASAIAAAAESELAAERHAEALAAAHDAEQAVAAAALTVARAAESARSAREDSNRLAAANVAATATRAALDVQTRAADLATAVSAAATWSASQFAATPGGDRAARQRAAQVIAAAAA